MLQSAFAGDLQRFDAVSLSANILRVDSAISWALRRSKSISYGVNVRGAGEVPSLRLSKAVEGVAETLLPPPLELGPVFPSELMDLLLGWIQPRRIWLARQSDCADNLAALLLDPSAQIGQCTALADEVPRILPGGFRG